MGLKTHRVPVPVIPTCPHARACSWCRGGPRSATLCPASPKVACPLFFTRRPRTRGNVCDALWGSGNDPAPNLSPAAASALGCRCTHRNVTATVVQMGSGGTIVASRGRQRVVAAAAVPPFVQPTGDVMRPIGNVRIQNGHGFCSAAPPLQSSPIGRSFYLDEGAFDRWGGLATSALAGAADMPCGLRQFCFRRNADISNSCCMISALGRCLGKRGWGDIAPVDPAYRSVTSLRIQRIQPRCPCNGLPDWSYFQPQTHRRQDLHDRGQIGIPALPSKRPIHACP